MEHAKRRMNDPASLLEIAESAGLSNGSRLDDHFVHLEAVAPGEYRRGRAGLIVHYGVHDTPFGSTFVATTARGICQFGFVDHQPEGAALRQLVGPWPQAELRATMPLIQTMFRQVASDAQVAAKPVGFPIPCHRVIQQSGRLGGYHWGETAQAGHPCLGGGPL